MKSKVRERASRENLTTAGSVELSTQSSMFHPKQYYFSPSAKSPILATESFVQNTEPIQPVFKTRLPTQGNLSYDPSTTQYDSRLGNRQRFVKHRRITRQSLANMNGYLNYLHNCPGASTENFHMKMRIKTGYFKEKEEEEKKIKAAEKLEMIREVERKYQEQKAKERLRMKKKLEET